MVLSIEAEHLDLHNSSYPTQPHSSIAKLLLIALLPLLLFFEEMYKDQPGEFVCRNWIEFFLTIGTQQQQQKKQKKYSKLLSS